MDRTKNNFFFNTPKRINVLQQYLSGLKPCPLEVVLHLNTFCNHNCNFCYHTKNSYQNNFEIETEYIIQTIKELNDLGIEKFIISGGGEPLLYKNINEVFASLIETNREVHLYTNLDVNINGLSNVLSKINKININLNTTNKPLYNLTRGKSAKIDRVISNLKFLNNIGAVPVITMIVGEQTINDLESSIEWLQSNVHCSINVSPPYSSYGNQKIEQNANMFDKLKEIKEKYYFSDTIRILEPEPLSIRTSGGNVFCKSHYFDITIGADYHVYPCCAVSYLDGYSILDLKGFKSFKEAWSSKERVQLLEKFKPTCSSCWFAPVNEIIYDQKID